MSASSLDEAFSWRNSNSIPENQSNMNTFSNYNYPLFCTLMKFKMFFFLINFYIYSNLYVGPKNIKW